MVFDHTLNVQILETNNVILVDQSAAQLMAEISSFVSNAFVDTSHNLRRLAYSGVPLSALLNRR